jgi:hypothetical protein
VVAAVATRPTKWLGAAAVVAVLLLAGVSSASPRATPTTLVWFGPLPNDWPAGVTGPDFAYVGSKDFMALFKPRAPWRRAARGVKIFALGQTWLESRPVSPARLKLIVADLKRRHMGLALAALGLPAEVPSDCGFGIEGFAGLESVPRLASAIKQAGGTLKYVIFDHPYDSGHVYAGPNACRWSPERVASELGRSVRLYRRYFPHVAVGDDETIQTQPQELAAWLDTFKRVNGTPLNFIHLDTDFTRPRWAAEARELENLAHARGVRFGIIYYGGYGRHSDEEWTGASEQRFVEYELGQGLRPDDAVFESWEDRPDYVLPETKRATFTWLIDRYLRPRPILTLQTSGDTAGGRLTRRNGQPLPGEPIELTATPLDGPGTYSESPLTGTVPGDARIALLGYRVNTECDCSGAADFTLYESRYQEEGGPNRVPNARFDSGLDGWGTFGDATTQLEPSDRGGQALHVTAAPGQAGGINGTAFRVTPGARFTITFAARIAPSSVGSGYFAVMFLGPSSDAEVLRGVVPFAVTPTSLGTATTDSRGAFSLPFPALPPASYLVQAWFRGGSTMFPAYASGRVAH